MLLDHRESAITAKIRISLSFLVEPIRLLAHAPFDITQTVNKNMISRESLLIVNSQLQQKQALLQVKLQRTAMLQQENVQLRALLNTLPKIDGRVSGAEILSTHMQTGNQLLLLDKGKSSGVFVGQSVLDSHGLLGQIIRVDWFHSIVLPVTDLKSAVPVEVLRTGEKGIVSGTGQLDTLLLNNVPKTAHLKKNDLIVTSTLGKHFPAGYPVGIIRMIKKNDSDMFAQISVSPVTTLQHDRFVFLLWPGTKPQSYIAARPPK